MANQAQVRKHRRVWSGIVLRFSLLVSLSVLVTATIVYLGMEYRITSLYRLEQRNRMSFLINTIVHGTKNLIASPAAYGRIPGVVDETISRAFSQGDPIASCRITSRDGTEVFRFEDSSQPGKQERTCLSRPVLSGDEKLGEIELCTAEHTIFEAERMRQILTIGNTLSAIIRTYLLQNDYFQIRDLAEKFTREDPNILYCAVLSEKGDTIYSFNLKDYQDQIPDSRFHIKRLSRKSPVFIFEAGRRGEIVDATYLIEHRGETLGAVRIGYSMASLRASILTKRRALRALILAVTLAALALSILAARNVAGPVRNLSAAVSAAAGKTPERDMDFEAAESEMEAIIATYDTAASKIKTRSDELGDLANSFSSLLETLKARFRELGRFYHRMSRADRLGALGQLSAGIAHEINNPLTIISTYVQMMQRRDDLDDEMKEEIEIMRQEIQRIAGKVKELLSFAQEKPPEMIPSNARDFLAEVARLARHELKRKNIQLVENFDAPSELLVSIDNNQMRQVFLNLIFNAVHSMGEGGTLTVETRHLPKNNYLEISVSDTGAGMPPEVLPRIFDPFFTTKSTEEGTGLGLSIVYRIIEAH
ncbi:MAG: ATP-binding protein, partial [bacterium]